MSEEGSERDEESDASDDNEESDASDDNEGSDDNEESDEWSTSAAMTPNEVHKIVLQAYENFAEDVCAHLASVVPEGHVCSCASRDDVPHWLWELRIVPERVYGRDEVLHALHLHHDTDTMIAVRRFHVPQSIGLGFCVEANPQEGPQCSFVIRSPQLPRMEFYRYVFEAAVPDERNDALQSARSVIDRVVPLGRDASDGDT